VVPHCHPFCGTGTTIVAALKDGGNGNSVGVDTNYTNFHELNSRQFAKFASRRAYSGRDR